MRTDHAGIVYCVDYFHCRVERRHLHGAGLVGTNTVQLQEGDDPQYRGALKCDDNKNRGSPQHTADLAKPAYRL